jgi:uncharacterized protein
VNFQTPGIYFERPQARSLPAAQRTDVAGFVGIAERGPLHQPVRLQKWREFQQVFGGFLPYAHLAYAVYAFFENGGQACWVARTADALAACAAHIQIPEPAQPGSMAVGPSCVVHAIDPGTWGDALSVTLQPAKLAETRHVVISGLPPNQLAVERTVGLYPGSRVLLAQTQGSDILRQQRLVAVVNALTGVLTLDANLYEPGQPNSLNPADANQRITVQSLEFTLLVRRENEVLERFTGLAFETVHPAYAPGIVNQQSRQVRLAPESGFPIPPLPWEGTLRGGLNGLRTLDVFDYAGDPATEVEGLAALARVDEVSILLIPDLVMRAEAPVPQQRSRRVRIEPCGLDTPGRNFSLNGKVLDAETNQPLPGVTVEADDGVVDETPKSVMTALDGSYQIDDLLPTNIDLTVRLAQYEVWQERIVDARLEESHVVILRPVDLPPRLSEDDIFSVQEAMITQCERLRDRFAILDVPLRADGRPRDLGEVIAWRARYDTAFAALYYPWLIAHDPAVSGPYTPRLMPPSGHMAGMYAVTDLSQGVYRAPANHPLAFVDDLTLPIDDRAQGALNPIGINAIRAFPGRAIRPYGARTLVGTLGSRFVNERRFLNMLIETLYDGLQWAVFEPINPDLQSNLRLWITTLLDSLWRQGALVGAAPEEAYRVLCDDTTTPPEVRAEGRLIAEVAVAPTTPYEFILLNLGFTLDELTISEI